MIISVDHGNKSIKTPNLIFTSGLVESENRPGIKTDCIFWDGKYYSLTEKRMSSGSDLVYSGAIFEYQNSFLQYLNLQDCGMFAAHGENNQSEELLNRLKEAGRHLKD